MDWLELLSSGLTFDLLGLAPARGLESVDIRHLVDLAPDDLARCENLGLAPGPHLAGVVRSPPILRTLLRLGASLADSLDDVVGVVWRPSGVVSSPQAFSAMIGQWLEGGPFPLFALAGLVETQDGEASDGLDFLLGREMRAGRAVTSDRADAARLIVRVADRLIHGEPLTTPQTFVLPDGRSIVVADDGAEILIGPG